MAHALAPGEPADQGCEPPARKVSAMWSPAIASEVRTSTSDAHVAVLDTAYWSWRAVRGEACRAPPALRHRQLHCLDGVLARFDALRRAFAHTPGAAAEELAAQLIDPEVCHEPNPVRVPQLTLVPTPSVIDAYAMYARSQTDRVPSDAEMLSLIATPAGDPCARVLGILAFEAASRDVPRKRALVEDAIGAASRCADDRLRADLLIAMIPYRRELPMIGPRGRAVLDEAQVAAGAMRGGVEAALAMQSLAVARERGQWDYALQLADLAIAGYRSHALPVRMLRAIIERNRIRLERSEPGDLEAVIADAQAWRPFAARHQAELARRLDVEAAKARFGRGEVEAAHAALVQLWRDQPPTTYTRKSRAITGIVVDAHGNPAAHARVAASRYLTADAVDLALPDLAFNHDLRDDDLRIVTTDAAGRFAIRDAALDGVIVAELGERRSIPSEIADHVMLVLEPTRRVSGKVDLAQVASTRVRVYVGAMAAPRGPVRHRGPGGSRWLVHAVGCARRCAPDRGVDLLRRVAGRAHPVRCRTAIAHAGDGGLAQRRSVGPCDRYRRSQRDHHDL